MKKFALILSTLWLAATVLAAEPAWLTDIHQASDQARKEHALLLLDFTGSDWCSWCMKLDAETFSRPEFMEYARNNLVLVRLDFPRQKPQSDELKAANRALQDQYKVNGFPTILVLKPDGSVLWEQRGYAPGGPSAMIDAVNKCRRAAGLPVAAKPVATAVAAPAKPAPPVPVAAVPMPRPAPPPRRPGDEPKLQGILYSASHSSAVLDGESCEEGDTVHGMRVLKIARDNVTVESQGQIKVLRMN
jgi:protein disulfide-isomerase